MTDIGQASCPVFQHSNLPYPFEGEYAVAIWPVTSQGVKNTKWPAVSYSRQISQNRKILANLNYHISIKTSQAILECLIDLGRVVQSWVKITRG